MTSSSIPAETELHSSPAAGRRKLVVHGPAPKHTVARWSVVALSLVAVGLQVASFFEPWWSIKLYAPQYPKGLRVVISLTGVSGDVREVDILNHYIGMSSLLSAAPTERRLAVWGIAFLAVAIVALTLVLGKKLGKLLAVPGLLFPLAFLADSFYWMYRFGHSLNPEAPIRLPPFTPELFGNGKIGQFMTFAQPMTGFWLAAGAFVALVAAMLLRTRVCKRCVNAGACGAICKDAFVGPKAGVER